MSQRLTRRQITLRGYTFLCACSIPHIAQAQRIFRFTGKACGISHDIQLGKISAFDSASEAKQIVDKICSSVGLPANFDIIAVKRHKHQRIRHHSR